MQPLQVCVASKALPQIGAYVAERDVSVRNAALDCLVAAYQSYGEKMWKHLAKLEPKEKDMLMARLKKTTTNAPAAVRPSTAPTPDRCPCRWLRISFACFFSVSAR